MKSYNSIKRLTVEPMVEMVEPILENNSQWVPLVDFAVKRGVSLSTLRRYIKQGKVVFRVENGRYLLRDDGSFPRAKVHPLQVQVVKLESDLQKAQEEIAELKTLIAFYEDSRTSS